MNADTFEAPVVSKDKISFVPEIQRMMHGFGDHLRPKVESAQLVEEIVKQQLTEILLKATEVSSNRGATTISIEDILFLMRKSPVKVQRFVKYMANMDLCTSGNPVEMARSEAMGDLKRMKRCRDFLTLIDTDPSGALSRALDEQHHDAVRLERLKRLDKLSKNLDEKQYAEFCRARQFSFLGPKMKLMQKFYEWIIQDAHHHVESISLDRSGLEAVAYLAHQTVGYLVDMAGLVKHEESCSSADPVTRCMAHFMYNTEYHLPDSPAFSAPIEDAACGKASGGALEPRHFYEALRRFYQSSTVNWNTGCKTLPIIAL